MKTALIAIMAGLQSLVDNYQIRDEGMVNFKLQQAALQAIIDTPDTVPATEVQTVVATGQLTEMRAILENIEAWTIKQGNTAPAAAAPAPTFPPVTATATPDATITATAAAPATDASATATPAATAPTTPQVL